jgi:hypothetical protein
MSPTWPRSLAARTTPRPCTWVRVLPVAVSASWTWILLALRRASTRRRSPSRSRANSRRQPAVAWSSSRSPPLMPATRPYAGGPGSGRSGAGRWKAPAGSAGRWPSGWSLTVSTSWTCRPSSPPACGSYRWGMAQDRPGGRDLGRGRRPHRSLAAAGRRRGPGDGAAPANQAARGPGGHAHPDPHRLHRLLADLVLAGAGRNLTADGAAALLRTLRPARAPAAIRRQLAADLIADVRVLDGGSKRWGRASRPRWPSPRPAWYRRKRAEGKSSKEALRCLKRWRSDAVYRCLLTDQHDQRSAAGRTI